MTNMKIPSYSFTFIDKSLAMQSHDEFDVVQSAIAGVVERTYGSENRMKLANQLMMHGFKIAMGEFNAQQDDTSRRSVLGRLDSVYGGMMTDFRTFLMSAVKSSMENIPVPGRYRWYCMDSAGAIVDYLTESFGTIKEAMDAVKTGNTLGITGTAFLVDVFSSSIIWSSAEGSHIDRAEEKVSVESS